MEEKTASQVVYEEILNLFNTLKKPVSLWQIYQACKKKGFSLWKVRHSLKWLFDHYYLKWEGNEIIPIRRY